MGRAEDWAAAREESRRLLEEADVERAGFGEADVSSEYRSPAWIDDLLGPQDPLERFRAEQEKLAAERAAFRQREADDTNTRRSRDWERWATGIIARELEERDQLWIEAVGGAIAEIRHQLRGEFAQALAKLTAQGDATVAELRAELAVAKGFGDGTLVDVTPITRKTRNDAA